MALVQFQMSAICVNDADKNAVLRECGRLADLAPEMTNITGVKNADKITGESLTKH